LPAFAGVVVTHARVAEIALVGEFSSDANGAAGLGFLSQNWRRASLDVSEIGIAAFKIP
jgi:hypothetical protein